MIGTYANERQLASIDGATALGQLADDTVLAVLFWRSTGTLNEQSKALLLLVADWLERSAQALNDPLHISLTTPGTPLPGLNSFGPDVAGLAFGLPSGSRDAQGAVAVLTTLRASVLALANGSGLEADADQVQSVFDHLAQAMLSTADSLLAPAARNSWATTVSF